MTNEAPLVLGDEHLHTQEAGTSQGNTVSDVFFFWLDLLSQTGIPGVAWNEG